MMDPDCLMRDKLIQLWFMIPLRIIMHVFGVSEVLMLINSSWIRPETPLLCCKLLVLLSCFLVLPYYFHEIGGRGCPQPWWRPLHGSKADYLRRSPGIPETPFTIPYSSQLSYNLAWFANKQLGLDHVELSFVPAPHDTLSWTGCGVYRALLPTTTKQIEEKVYLSLTFTPERFKDC